MFCKGNLQSFVVCSYWLCFWLISGFDFLVSLAKEEDL